MSTLLSRIVIHPDVCHGQPVVRGLRYPVEALLEYLAGGDSIEDLLLEYPDLTREDILACLEFAAVSIRLKFLRPTESEECARLAGSLASYRGDKSFPNPKVMATALAKGLGHP